MLIYELSFHDSKIAIPPKLFSVTNFKSNGIYWLPVLLSYFDSFMAEKIIISNRELFVSLPELISACIRRKQFCLVGQSKHFIITLR